MPRGSPGSSEVPMPRTPAAVAVFEALPCGGTNPAPSRRRRSTASTVGPRELYDLERLFRAQRGIVLHAMGGMGKTALADRGRPLVDAKRPVSRRRMLHQLRAVCKCRSCGAGARAPTWKGRCSISSPPPSNADGPSSFSEKRMCSWSGTISKAPCRSSTWTLLDHDSPYTDDERGRLSELVPRTSPPPGPGPPARHLPPRPTPELPGALPYELHGLARADSLWLLSHILKRDCIPLERSPAHSREDSIRC